MPKRVNHAHGYVNEAAALANAAVERLTAVARGRGHACRCPRGDCRNLNKHLPFCVWQTASRTNPDSVVLADHLDVNHDPALRAWSGWHDRRARLVFSATAARLSPWK